MSKGLTKRQIKEARSSLMQKHHDLLTFLSDEVMVLYNARFHKDEKTARVIYGEMREAYRTYKEPAMQIILNNLRRQLPYLGWGGK